MVDHPSEEISSTNGESTASISDRTEQPIGRVILLASKLLYTEELSDFIDELARIVMENFPVKALIVYILDDHGIYQAKGVYGFPPERIQEIKEKTLYTFSEVQEMENTHTRPLGRFSKFYPAELVDLSDEREILTSLDVHRVHEPRKNKDDFHPLDAVVIEFLDRSEKEIGSFFITDTTTGKHLSEDDLSGLEILASFASVAIELTNLRMKEQDLLTAHERRAAQISQILAVTSSIATLADTAKLIKKVLELTLELFGFDSSAIALYDETEGCFRWKAVRGYSDEQTSRALNLRLPLEIIERDIKPEFRIGYLAHYRPAEKILPEDLPYFFMFESLENAKKAMNEPRKASDAWHALDDLTFVIYDRTGKPIGIISPDNPTNGKIPSRETLEMLEVFVSMVAISFENADIYHETTASRDEVRVLNRLMFHDLMNYSMAIRGYCDLALTQTVEELQEKYVERAMKQIEQTSELIGKVRKLSAIRSADRKNLLRIDIARTITVQANKTASIFPAKKVKFNFSFEKEEAFVMANDLLPDLFHNIFMNAIKFDMHENIVIDVGLKEIIDNPVEPQSKHWLVTIADHGPGIPDERKQTIFIGTQKLGPTEPARGMGLGLSIVKSLVGLYGGRVWVDDREPGDHSKGIVFKVKLPEA